MSSVVSRNPYTGAVVFSAPSAGRNEVSTAVGRAAAAAAGWSATPTEERAAVLRRFADLVEADADEAADLIVAEVGKLRSEALGEVEWTARSARYYADHPPALQQRAGAVVRRRPVGVVATITPWNVPLVTPAWKWLPALMAGNTIVWKPSEVASATALAAVEWLQRAGLPPDGIVAVLGDGEVGRAVAADPRVNGVSFTGSTRAGRAIAEQTSRRFVPCTLEMSGINVAVVFVDADLDHAVDCVAAASTAINGQKCTATRRVLVERGVAEAFEQRLGRRYEALRFGDPTANETTLGPLISAAASERARLAVAAAVGRGARVAGRCAVDTEVATAFPATVLTELSPADPLRRQELFAPVTAIDVFDADDDVWELANDSPYGLSAAVHTADPVRMRAALDRLQAGVIAVNRRTDAVDLEAPFGGVKDSGNGRFEGGEFAYDGCTTQQAAYGTDGLASHPPR